MLAIAGGKGGCGKTTTTIGLARLLAERGHRPVAVDADCDMPDLDVVAETPIEPGLDAIASGEPIASAVHDSPTVPGVRIVPAGTAVTAGPALARLENLDRPVLVDCPAGASPAVADVFRVADAVLLVSTPTRESLEDTTKTAAMARALDAAPRGVVLTRCGRDLDVSRLFDCPLAGRVPETDDPLSRRVLRAAYRDEMVTRLGQKA